jgi:hypothetical protein
MSALGRVRLREARSGRDVYGFPVGRQHAGPGPNACTTDVRTAFGTSSTCRTTASSIEDRRRAAERAIAEAFGDQALPGRPDLHLSGR